MGWRKAVYVSTGHLVNLGAGPAERVLRDQFTQIGSNIPGNYTIAVISIKGGVGKTRTTAALGTVYATYRTEPVLALAELARQRGVAVFFLTGRPERMRAATEANLRAAGYAWTGLILRPDDLTTRSAAEFKAPERKKIEEQGYTIIVNVGDQASDLDGGFAEKTYKLPNPFYLIP